VPLPPASAPPAARAPPGVPPPEAPVSSVGGALLAGGAGGPLCKAAAGGVECAPGGVAPPLYSGARAPAAGPASTETAAANAVAAPVCPGKGDVWAGGGSNQSVNSVALVTGAAGTGPDALRGLELGARLARGAFGSVFHGRWHKTDCAVKVGTAEMVAHGQGTAARGSMLVPTA
jgi:hypothetical protein